MFKNMTLGQYFPGNSVIHRLDPRTKLILTLGYIVLIFLVKNVWGYLVAAAFVMIGAGLSGIRLKYLLKGLKPVLYIVIFTFLINLFFSRGDVILYQWKFVKIYQSGLQFAVFMSLRLIFLIIGSQLLTLTTSPLMLTDGIETLLRPLKTMGLPVHELAMMMTIALRFIPTLLEETDKLMKAQASRGADFESGNIVRRAKNMLPLLVPLFVSAFRRADELALAMEARCYRGGQGRTRMKQLVYSSLDGMAAVVGVMMVAAVIVINTLPW